jgi:RND family efflux transporter MFP subunit
MKLLRPVPLLIVLAGAAAFGFWRWQSGSQAGQATLATKPPALVSAQAIHLQSVPAELSTNGTITALKMVDIRAQVTTTVKEVLFKEGDDVRAGQVLFRLDDRNDRVNLDKAKAQAAKSRAALKDLERQLARAQELRSQQFIAQSALDSAQAQVYTQREAVAADQAAVRNAEVALSYNEIRAPFAGRAGAVSVYPGSWAMLTRAGPVGEALTRLPG